MGIAIQSLDALSQVQQPQRSVGDDNLMDNLSSGGASAMAGMVNSMHKGAAALVTAAQNTAVTLAPAHIDKRVPDLLLRFEGMLAGEAVHHVAKKASLFTSIP